MNTFVVIAVSLVALLHQANAAEFLKGYLHFKDDTKCLGKDGDGKPASVAAGSCLLVMVKGGTADDTFVIVDAADDSKQLVVADADPAATFGATGTDLKFGGVTGVTSDDVSKITNKDEAFKISLATPDGCLTKDLAYTNAASDATLCNDVEWYFMKGNCVANCKTCNNMLVCETCNDKFALASNKACNGCGTGCSMCKYDNTELVCEKCMDDYELKDKKCAKEENSGNGLSFSPLVVMATLILGFILCRN